MQSQAKKFETRKSRGFSSPSLAHMFEILQESTLARVVLLEKKKQENLLYGRGKPMKAMRIGAPPSPASRSE
jgi:hypothetical protein